jgi:hypothetical protein
MQKLGYLTIVLTLLIGSAEASAQQAWSEVSPGTVATPGTPSTPAAPTGGPGVTYFNDRMTFQGAGTILTSENFDSSLTPPANVCNAAPPLNSLTNDACYAPGDLQPGWELDILLAGASGDYVLLTDGFLGNTGNAVGPNSFAEGAIFRFDPAVNAVGFDVIGDLAGPVNIGITVYDAAGNVLGTSSSAGSVGGTFWGVTSTTPIGRIETVDPDPNGGELFSRMQFGNLGVPAAEPRELPSGGTFGSLLLAAMLAGLGLWFVRRF